MDKIEKAQQLAKEAKAVLSPLTQFCTLPLVRSQGSDAFLGTGVLFEVGAEVFVLTAHHHAVAAASDGGGLSTVCPDQTNLGFVDAEIIPTDDRLDVALIRPTGSQARTLLAHGYKPVRQDQIDRTYGVGDWPPIQNDRLLVVYGFPAARAACDSVIKHVTPQAMGMCCLPDHAKEIGRFFPGAHVVLTYPSQRHESVVAADSGLQVACDPEGLSGGGVWSLPMARAGKWSLDDARLVAIQSAQIGDLRLLCTRVGVAMDLIESRFAGLGRALRLSHGVR